MAFDLTATLLQPLRSRFGNLDKNIQRQSIYGAYNAFTDQTSDPNGILTAEDITKLKASFGNTVQLPVIDYQNATLSNVRTCAMQTGGVTSKLVTLTFATVAFGIAMAPAIHNNNQVSYATAFRKQMEAGLTKTAALLDTTARNTLEAAKNAYFPAALTAFYAQTAGALQVPAAAWKDDYYNNIPSIMATMDYAGTVPTIVTDPMGMGIIRKLNSQGTMNANNTAYQVLNTDYYQSNRIISGAGVKSTQYLINPGSLAFVNRLDPDALMNHKAGAKEWGVIRNMPIINQDMAVFYQADCSDQSAAMAAGVSGLTRSLVESWEISMDYVFVTPYNDRPSTDYAAVQKVELLAA